MKRLSAKALALLALALAAHAEPNNELIRITTNQWGFETSVSNTPFVPFGANFVFNEKRYLNLFGPGIYDRERYERALAALEQLRFNIVKVFLPIGQVLPDPQVPGEARIAPGYLDNLEEFLRMAHRHQIRVIVCLACWGGNDIKWWHEGGEYFGRRPWRNDPGIDSRDVLAQFWTQLAARLRDNPAVFSYNPEVEWTFPAGNLTWTPPDQQYGRLETKPGLFYWRAFLQARYQTIAAQSRIDQKNAAPSRVFRSLFMIGGGGGLRVWSVNSMSDVTRLLNDGPEGDPLPADELLPLVYNELRRLAAAKLANEAAGHTLQPTALVHEAWLRVSGADTLRLKNRQHFFAVAAEAMRRILVESARRKRSLKRGGNAAKVELEEFHAIQGLPSDEVLAVHEALDMLAAKDPTSADLVKMLYFAGMTMEQAAAALELPKRTAEERWTHARAWLRRAIAGGKK